jgi:hypothetical protein
MQKGREVQDNVFEPSGFGDFGFHRSMMMPSLFGGRDPFDEMILFSVTHLTECGIRVLLRRDQLKSTGKKELL